jgi:hypothetical protein
VPIQFMQYGTAAHRDFAPQPGVLFADFSPFVPMVETDGQKVHDPEVLRAWGESGSYILDHHKGARPIVDAFGPNGRFGDESVSPGVCGAVLVYHHLWRPVRQCTYEHEVERFARLAGIRDTWVRNSPEWEDACKQADVLMFVPRDRWMEQSLEEILVNWDFHYGWVAEVLQAKQNKSVDKSIEGGYRHTTAKGTRMILIDGTKTTGDVCDKLSKEVDLVVGYMTLTEKGSVKTVYSTRAPSDFNCLALAQKNGGGGHTRAAAFSVIGLGQHPISEVIRIVDEYES